MKRFIKLMIFAFVFLAGFLTFKATSYAWYTSILIIYYQYEDGTDAAETYRQDMAPGDTYSVTSPLVPGYAPDKDVIEGTFTESIAFWVKYSPVEYDLVINYVDENNNQVFDSYNGSFKASDTYSIESPSKEGYTPNIAKVEGSLTEDTTINVIYTRNEYSLKINYIDENGNILTDSYEEVLKYNDSYEVNSPDILGYKPDKEVVSGVITDNTEIDVIYNIIYLQLTIYYVDVNGNQLISPTTMQLKYFEDYQIVTPKIDGYYTEETNVIGSIGKDNIDIYVVYHKKTLPHSVTQLIITIASYIFGGGIGITIIVDALRRWLFPRF